MSFAAITICVADSQREFVVVTVVLFISVRKRLVTPLYMCRILTI
jgi:hypothetical protein